MTDKHTICPVCGSEKPEHRKFCSIECKARWQSKGRWKPCATCGQSFWARESQEKKGYANYCSRECHFAERNQKRTFRCICCGTPIHRTPYQIERGWTRFCSQDCLRYSQRRLNTHGGGRINLFTNWQKREWKDDHCARCGETEDLQLDHITPRFAGGETVRENAQTLCRRCNLDKYWQEDLPYYTEVYESSHGRG